MQLKPNHSQAAKELAALQELESAVKGLEAVAAQSDTAGAAVDAAAAQQLLDRVYKTAPDCIAAQLLEAKLQMAQRNYEEVRFGVWGLSCGVFEVLYLKLHWVQGTSSWRLGRGDGGS